MNNNAIDELAQGLRDMGIKTNITEIKETDAALLFRFKYSIISAFEGGVKIGATSGTRLLYEWL